MAEEVFVIPASFVQQRLWFLEQLQPGAATYNMSAAVHLHGQLNVAALEWGLYQIINRHEVLRTTFAEVDGMPVQVITPEPSFNLGYVDLRSLPEDAREGKVEQMASEEAQRPFDLTHGPLLRAALLQLSSDEHILFVTVHHIVADGWSISILIREMATLYEAFINGQDSPLPDLPVQYADYTLWQQEFLSGEILQAHLAYWKQKLQEPLPILELHTDHPRPPFSSLRGARLPFTIPKSIYESLKVLSRHEGVTLFMTLLSAFKALLHRYTKEEDILVGTPVSGRNSSEVESLIGFFVDTLVMRTDLSGNPTFRQLLQRVRDVALQAYAHQEVPFDKLVEHLQPQRHLSHTPLFQVMFALDNTPKQSLNMAGLTAYLSDLDTHTAKFDISLLITESMGGLSGSLQYKSDLFDPHTAERFIDHFNNLLQAIIADPDMRLLDLPLMTRQEQQSLLARFNDTQASYPGEKCVHELFEAQAERTPDACAVTFAGECLSYRQLNQRANQLAHHLNKLGLGTEAVIAISLPRSAEMLVAILGVLKSGGAYLPLDPTYPAQRLSFMLSDCGVKALLVQDNQRAVFADYPGQVIRIDQDWGAIDLESRDNPQVVASSENLAYILYTSGSMGQPKGVMIEHRNLVNYLHWVNTTLIGDQTHRMPAVTALTFDASLKQLIAPLLRGNEVWLLSDDQAADPAALLEALKSGEGVTLNCVPSLWKALLEIAATDEGKLTPLTAVLVGGEQVNRDLIEQSFAALPHLCIWNLYGPTEVTANACAGRLSLEAEITIGRPISNIQIYLLDSSLRPVPIGVAGELYIGGEGVGRGYRNHPEITADRFIPNPFSDRPGARLYKTGDVGRYLADGQIVYMGRNDHQVKVRGFRIELGEIEAALMRQPGVKDTVAVAQELSTGGNQVIAYVVPQNGCGLDISGLRDSLKGTLPEYMIPSAIVEIDKLPLTPSGKLDRRSLPPVEQSLDAKSASPRLPRTGLEEIVCSIFCEVLKVKRCSPTDDFFELGGHSLIATRVVSRVREAFGVEMGVRRLFERPTAEGVAQVIEEEMGVGEREERKRIERVSREGEMWLSSSQQRLWFLHQLEPQSAAYNIAIAMRISGVLDIESIEKSISEIVRRHEVLRTSFATIDGRPVQVIREEAKVALVAEELSVGESSEREAVVRKLMEEEAEWPFDLEAGPLFRVRLLRLGEEEHALLVSMHHIISDGWSMGVLVKEFTTLYEANRRGESAQLEELAVQYADYAAWQREWLNSSTVAQQLSYWRERLAGAPRMLELTDKVRPAVQSKRGAKHIFRIGKDVVERLKEVSRREGVTLFMTLMGAFNVMLSRYSGQEDIVVGTPVAGRNQSEVENLIGFFVNTVVMRTDLSGDPSLRELLRSVKEVALEAYTNQEVPFEKVVEELKLERDMSHEPVFQVMFVLQNMRNEEVSIEGARVSVEKVDTGTAKFDLLMMMEESEEGLEGSFEYSKDLFDLERIKRMAEYYERVAGLMAEKPELRIGELGMLSESEQRALLYEYNNTRKYYPIVAGIQELFQEQVLKMPAATAAVFEGQNISYQELNRRANQLAHHLQRFGIKKGDRVGICIDRSIEMIVAVLGILKAGAAYLPLDAEFPRERLKVMIEDAQASLVLTQERNKAKLEGFDERLIYIDSDWSTLALESDENPTGNMTETDLAYVIYTSGSTGKPKGIAMPHGPLINLIQWQLEQPDFAVGANVLQFASLSFDVSFQELFSTWLSGGALYLIPEGLRRDTESLLRFLTENKIERVFLPFVALQQLAEVADDLGLVPSSLLEVITAGEQLQITRQVFSLFSKLGGCSLHNQYGPSESHVVTAHSLHHPPDQWPALPPIGVPVSNAKIFLLNARLQPVPVGVRGELYIGGNCLSQGYLNRPEMTAEKFIPNPFGNAAGARLYRTGDAARYLPDGNIEFLGRIDNQVKVRGYRVELSEIESTLMEYPSIKEAVAVVTPGSGADKQVVAYLVAAGEQELIVSQVRAYLREKLPEYMIPSAIVEIDKLPLTPSGKLDRRSLPPIEQSLDAKTASPRLPRTGLEEIVCSIFCEVLKVKRCSPTDDFFELGGHSLIATRVVSRVREAFGVEMGVRRLFERPTAEGVAQVIEEEMGVGEREERKRIERVSREGEMWLSSSQQRLWFLHQLEPQSAFYNLAGSLRLTGPLDVAALAATLSEIARRHETLRTSFEQVEGRPVQVIDQHVRLELPLIDLTQIDAGISRREATRIATAEAQRGFDLSQAPLIRTNLVKLSQQEHRLIVVMHHIISDGWSMKVMITEMAAIYEAMRQGKSAPLKELSIQYADYAAWQQEWLESEHIKRKLEYWKQRLSAEDGLLELATDKVRPAVQSYRGRVERRLIGAELSERLKEVSRRERVTMYMLLLAAYYLVLYRYSGQERISVGSPVANRRDVEVEGLIGLFINMVVMKVELSGDVSFKELVRRVKEVALEAYAHEEVGFEMVVEEVQPKRELSHSPLFQVMFAMQSEEMESVEMGGVKVEMEEVESGTAKYDLTMSVGEQEGGLEVRVEYNKDLYEEETIKRMLLHYELVLKKVTGGEIEQAIGEIDVMREEEKEQILRGWNETMREYDRDKTIHSLIEDQVIEQGEVVAIECAGEQMSYCEMNRRANQLARHLRQAGAGAESRVGICLERGTSLVVGLVGILKAGAAYVPLDPAYPRQRLSYMINDAQVSAVITQRRFAELFDGCTVPVMCLDEDARAIAQQSHDNPPTDVKPGNLAYVIYTSGSTGEPKGVMVTHENVVNFFTGMDERLGKNLSGAWLAVTSISFDISVLELMWTLTRGLRVVILKEYNASSLTVESARKRDDKRIDFSLFYFASDDQNTTGDKYRLLIEGAKFADRHGFSAVWTPERHFHEFGGLFPNPSVMGAALATITKRIQIRAGSVVLPLHNSIRVAEEWALVDNLSNGRVAISFASGWHADDFVFNPDNYKNRKEVMIEEIETVRRLWRGEAVSRRGGAGNQVEVRIRPHPIQSELPVWLTAAGSTETFRIAGEIGASLLTHLLGQSYEELSGKIEVYRDAWKKHHAGDGHVTLMLHTFVERDREFVREKVRKPFSNYLRDSADLTKGLARSLGKEIGSAEFTEADMQAILSHAFDRYFEMSGLFGTPDECLSMVDNLKSIGVDEIACLIDFGVEVDSVMTSLRYLDEVRQRSNQTTSAEDYSLPAQIVGHNISYMQCTPSLARTLTMQQGSVDALRSLRKLMLGGEALPVSLANQLREAMQGEIHNMYGPTETTIWSTTFQVESTDNKVPIGRPIANTETYILDQHLQPVPIGVPGDLYIGGEGVVRGYLNRPEVTAEKFIPNQFAPNPGARIYKTGDRVRYLADGNIEFLGRTDYQVKIDGYRIELGEIETALGEHTNVREAVVVPRQDANGNKRLVAYLVAKQQPGDNAIRQLSPDEQERLLNGRRPFRLPNGMVVAELSDFQTNVGYREMFEDQVYFQNEIMLEENDCVFDVGANIGLFTLFASQKCKNLDLYVFEPIPPTFEVLKTNLALQGLDVKLFQCGLGDKEQTSSFTFYPAMPGLSGRYADDAIDRNATKAIIQNWLHNDASEIERSVLIQEELDQILEERFKAEMYECQVRTLSDVIRENNVERIDLLKVDVERSEYDVLCGIEDEDWKKIKQIVIEVETKEMLDKITAMLEQRDYRLTLDERINIDRNNGGFDTRVYLLYATRRTAQAQLAEADKNRMEYSASAESGRSELSVAGLRAFLKERLPDYMIPTAFVFLDSLPLTPNGKVDRKSLPEPELIRPDLKANYVAPQTETERIVASIWQEALGLEEVGVHDNFFEVGGSSILLIQVNSKLRDAFGKNIPVVEMFRHPSVGSLAKYLTQDNQDEKPSLQKVEDRASKQTSAMKSFKEVRLRKKSYA